MDAKYFPANLKARGAPIAITPASVPSMAKGLPKDFGYRGPPPASKHTRFDPVPASRAPRFHGPTPKGWTDKPSSKSGCGCKGCGPSDSDVLHTQDLDAFPGAVSCSHYVDRREPPPASGVYRPMSVTFTASEYAALVWTWIDYENAHPRPGIGIDPSTNRPWSPLPSFGLDAAERAEFVSEHRWPQVSAYVFERSGSVVSNYARTIADTMARDYPWLESLHARMGLGPSAGSWNFGLALWLLTATAEWVCWRGVNIPPDPDTAANHFMMLGFYPPPTGVYAGGPVLLPVDFTEYMSPCPPGMHLERVPISPREWDLLYDAARAAEATTGLEIGMPHTHLNPDRWNARFLDHFFDQVRRLCPSCWESISVSEFIFLLRRDSIPLVPCAALALPADCSGRALLFYGHNVGWSRDGTLERLPPFRCVARGFGG